MDLDSLPPEAAAKLLHQQPKIMRRPLFVTANKLVVGFKPELLEELLGQ